MPVFPLFLVARRFFYRYSYDIYLYIMSQGRTPAQSFKFVTPCWLVAVMVCYNYTGGAVNCNTIYIQIQIQTVKTKHSFDYVAASGLVSMYRDNDFCLPVGRD